MAKFCMVKKTNSLLGQGFPAGLQMAASLTRLSPLQEGGPLPQLLRQAGGVEPHSRPFRCGSFPPELDCWPQGQALRGLPRCLAQRPLKCPRQRAQHPQAHPDGPCPRPWRPRSQPHTKTLASHKSQISDFTTALSFVTKASKHLCQLRSSERAALKLRTHARSKEIAAGKKSCREIQIENSTLYHYG